MVEKIDLEGSHVINFAEKSQTYVDLYMNYWESVVFDMEKYFLMVQESY